ncbi:hypothetical protein PsWM33_02525 [Pseudovibrio sp. WM33]|nr:hypothetical protein PsWM33_02525 [Pseudovibrio sp. WM33]
MSNFGGLSKAEAHSLPTKLPDKQLAALIDKYAFLEYMPRSSLVSYVNSGFRTESEIKWNDEKSRATKALRVAWVASISSVLATTATAYFGWEEKSKPTQVIVSISEQEEIGSTLASSKLATRSSDSVAHHASRQPLKLCSNISGNPVCLVIGKSYVPSRSNKHQDDTRLQPYQLMR